MNRQNLEDFPPPPGVLGSLRAGFDAVSSHVGLILLPVVLDLCLWLGPRLSVEALLNPFLRIIFNQAQLTLASSTEVKQFAEFQSAFSEAMGRFNLLSLLGKLQIFPIGISSLLAQKMPAETPFGSQPVVQISSLPGVLGLAFVFVVAGWIVGGLYFRRVSETALGGAGREMSITALWAILQTLLLSVIWSIALMMVLVPAMFVLAVLTLLSPVVASGAFFVMLLLAFWLIVPLFFTPHGIFVRKQNAFYSIFTSLRMARFTLPTSGLFVLCWFLLSTGLNYLWRVPPETSWMTLVGIGGHAFITTALLAASFVYYHDMNAWLQTVFEKLQQKQSIPMQRV
ncbi:MAG TPA: hypothetical protein VK249_27045 [Anaerolineales bacterium]|nr:hypothetical protein [Anaerolineales bacterium]